MKKILVYEQPKALITSHNNRMLKIKTTRKLQHIRSNTRELSILRDNRKI
jgi:hypothetical protein